MPAVLLEKYQDGLVADVVLPEEPEAGFAEIGFEQAEPMDEPDLEELEDLYLCPSRVRMLL